jgi:hypothetical protein
MVFLGGKWRTNHNLYNQNYHDAKYSRDKEERVHKNGEQRPLLNDNNTQQKTNGSLSPVYESMRQQASDQALPPPPPPPDDDSSYSNDDNHHHHHHRSYIQSVLFGGLWTRNRVYEDPVHQTGGGDEEEDRPSLTSNFEVDSDLAVLRLCGVYAALYVLMAVIAFSFVFEHWTIIDSMYFAVATFTTVGVRTLQNHSIVMEKVLHSYDFWSMDLVRGSTTIYCCWSAVYHCIFGLRGHHIGHIYRYFWACY